MAWIVVVITFVIHMVHMVTRDRTVLPLKGFLQLNAWAFFIALALGIFGLVA